MPSVSRKCEEFPLSGVAIRSWFAYSGLLECIPLHHVILLNVLLYSYKLNTLDAYWIAIDVWSNSSRCRQESSLLDMDVMPMFMIIALDVIITLHFSINCSAVICSPTVRYAILREATSETYGPWVSFPSYYISFIYIASRLLFSNLYFSIYTTKIPKIFILLCLSDLTFASGREEIDNPFIMLVARFLIVCAGTRRLACSILLDWYLGSQKLREILTLLLLHHPFLFKENQRKLKT